MKKILTLAILIGMISACSDKPTNDKKDIPSKDVVISNDTCRLIDNYLSKLSQEKGFSGGLLIIKDGKKIFCNGYGWADKGKKIPFTPNTLTSIGSITKAFTATAIMKLSEEGKVSLQDPLKKYFPNIPADKADITLHQLLTHSSGFHEFLKQDGGDYEKIETNAFLQRAFAEPLSFKPGEKAVYTNVGMSILGIIIEEVTGLEYEAYLKKALFEPQGIKSIGYHYPTSPDDIIAIGYQNGKPWGTHQDHFKQAGGGPYWNLKGNGGLEASLNEMYLWINSFTNHTILKEASIRQMFTAHIQEEGYNGESSFGYGCNISQSRRKTKMIMNGGSNGIYFARIVRLPEEGLVFYMVTNESSINTSMVLPNATQLYFQGKIEQDALTMQTKFRNEISKKIYDLLAQTKVTNLGDELKKNNLKVEDDMVLLEAGQALMQEKNYERALILYNYYTETFPNIVVAWNDKGDIYQALSNKYAAIKCYKQALQIRPANPRAKESLEKLTK